MNDDNSFDPEHRKGFLNNLLKHGLVRRITIIEGSYPSDREQKAFMDRIMDWLHRKPRQ